MNSSKLKGYLTGLIIGDGHIDKGITKRAFSIKTIYPSFKDKIFKDLSECTNFKIKIKEVDSYIDLQNVKHKKYWELRIDAHPYFNKKYNHFYDDYRKRRLSTEALNWLNIEGLANWYMSDGYICLVGKTRGNIVSRRIDFCTDRYKYEDILKIQKMFKNNFNIQTNIIKRNDSYRIRILKESYEIFISLIYPHIVPEMLFKLYLAYPNKPKWSSKEFWDLQNNLQSAIALTSNVEG